jgi:hypothetical protein
MLLSLSVFSLSAEMLLRLFLDKECLPNDFFDVTLDYGKG